MDSKIAQSLMPFVFAFVLALLIICFAGAIVGGLYAVSQLETASLAATPTTGPVTPSPAATIAAKATDTPPTAATATPVSPTPVLPTATGTPVIVATAAPTATSVPPTSTPVPPTATAVPPTSTATNTPPPTCAGPPVIESFTASPNPITAGGSTTLSWGAVTNADSASIDQGIGGVATPGSRTVSPATTTTYTLTATGCGGTATSQVTVTVNPAATNDISNFSATSVSATQLNVTVKYHYTGDHGASNIYMAAYAENSSGTGVPGTGFTPGGPLIVGDGTVTVQIKRVTPGAAFTSTQVRVCMYVGGGSSFYCEVFPYTKNW